MASIADGSVRIQTAHEQRRKADGSLRVVDGANIRSCRPVCYVGSASGMAKPRQVSVLLHPLSVAGAPILWRDWSRRVHRRACLQLVRDQQIEVSMSPPLTAASPVPPVILSRAQRAHARLWWETRLFRRISLRVWLSGRGQVQRARAICRYIYHLLLSQ